MSYRSIFTYRNFQISRQLKKAILPLITMVALSIPLSAQNPPNHPGIQQKINDQGWDNGGGGDGDLETNGGKGCQGCSGHAKGYPPGWTYKAVRINLLTQTPCSCETFLIDSYGETDFLGTANCTDACILGANRDS